MRWLVLMLAACGGSSVPDAPPGAITVTAGAITNTITGLRWGANNDCPASGAQVISVTIQGSGTGSASGAGIGLCLPRPDQIGSAALDLGDDTKVQLVGASASASDCMVTKASGVKPSGSVTFIGFSAKDGASYQVTLAGQVAAKATCVGASADAGIADVTLQLSGTALVTPR
jgi:hypothetical protein